MPVAVTLPYSFRQVPTSLPPSVVEGATTEKPRYITSSSGHTAHPDDVIASCGALQQHLNTTQEESKKLIAGWEQSIKERELAEKRRVAPGWLDRDEKILEPTKAGNIAQKQGLLDDEVSSKIAAPAMSPNREGEELDRVFGSLAMK
jgi:hypothetical protein